MDFLSNLANVLSLPFFRIIDFNSLKNRYDRDVVSYISLWSKFGISPKTDFHLTHGHRTTICEAFTDVLIRYVFGKLSMRVRWIRRPQKLNQYIPFIDGAKRLSKLSMVQVDKSK